MRGVRLMVGVVLPLAALLAELQPHRASGRKIVLTNGVFDLLHVGHLRYLEQARMLGGVLVVGVNADTSVAALKPGRPLVPEGERAELVAALRPVDYVIVFLEPTAEALLQQIRPDVYVKGGDYTEDRLPEAAVARQIGTRVVLLPLVPGRSTSELIRRISSSTRLPQSPRRALAARRRNKSG